MTFLLKIIAINSITNLTKKMHDGICFIVYYEFIYICK